MSANMMWLSPASDFRAGLRSAIDAVSPPLCLQKLAALATCRLDHVQTIQLDRALVALQAGLAKLPDGWVRVKLALLSTCTIDHLAPALRVAGLRQRLVFDLHVGAYGQQRQEVFGAGSALHAFRPQFVLLSNTATECLGEMALDGSTAEAEASIAAAIASLRSLWQHARGACGAEIIQQTLLDTTAPLFGSFDRQVPSTPAARVRRLNEKLGVAAREDGVLLLDIAAASARDGLDAWHDVTRWLQAKTEIAPHAAAPWGELAARVVAAALGRTRKCLVLDLDNTLWGGVVGDVGIEALVLGPGSATGEAHLALQHYARQLASRGVIVAVCSKNDPDIARTAFETHPEMALRPDDVAAFVANWEDKPGNLQAIARTLNIGLDAMVFVDDNPVERARMRDALPMVAVPELPDDPAQYVRCLSAAGYFEAVRFTADDIRRTGQYQANAKRDALQAGSASLDEFLGSLGMSVEYGRVQPVDHARAVQLINKTHQFNTTGRRYTAEEFTQLAASPRGLVLSFRLRDRFGDNGLVSVMAFVPATGAADLLELEAWVMSCRVFGRRLEFEAMNIAVEEAAARGATAIVATFRRSERNGVIMDLFRDLGFSRVESGAADNPASRWQLALADYAPQPTAIARKCDD